MTEQTIATIAKFIARDILNEPGRMIKSDENLISSGLVGSFCLVDLALFVEDHFHVRLADTELNAAHFDTLEQLAVLIHSRM